MMGTMTGKIRKTPQPQVEVGQLWGARGVVRRVVEPLEPFVIHFANVVTGQKSKVNRVSRWGSPSGNYEIVVIPNTAVHIRMQDAHTGKVLCGDPGENLVTTHRANLRWWLERAKKKQATMCPLCLERGRAEVGLPSADVEAA